MALLAFNFTSFKSLKIKTNILYYTKFYFIFFLYFHYNTKYSRYKILTINIIIIIIITCNINHIINIIWSHTIKVKYSNSCDFNIK